MKPLSRVKGVQCFNSDDIGDFIIRRGDGGSSFMFCNAIDDSLMGITHTLRGEDHLANTPRQLMILQALNMGFPQYGHLSLITGEDGTPLSKRHGSFGLHDLRQQGYLPAAVLNYLARLSHAYEQQSLLSFAELTKHFYLEKLSRASARFDLNQLLHWQKEAVLALAPSAVWQWLGKEIENKIPSTRRDLFIEVMQNNSLFPTEANQWAEILFGKALQFTPEQTIILKETGSAFFIAAQAAVKKYGAQLKDILAELKSTQTVSGKQLFIPLRIALTAKQHGPELVHIMDLLGAEEMIQRFQWVLEQVK
jgi:glutamyl/glutaminyl-tRNA synthetase